MTLSNFLRKKSNLHIFKNSFVQLAGQNPNADVLNLIKTIIDNEDEFYIKIYANGQEITSTSSSSSSNSFISDSKLLSEIGLKEMQSINVNINRHYIAPLNGNAKAKPSLATSSNNTKIDKDCVPMNIMSKEGHFTNLFRLLNTISSMNLRGIDPKFRKLASISAAKVWEVIMLLPTNRIYYDLIEANPEQYLLKLTEQISLEGQRISLCPTNGHISQMISINFPYQLLYYLQIVEIIYKQQQLEDEDDGIKNNSDQLWSKYFYKMLIVITKYLMSHSNNKSILLECVLIILRLFCNTIFLNGTKNGNKISSSNAHKHTLINDNPAVGGIGVENLDDSNNGETPRKKLKRIHFQPQQLAFQNSSNNSILFLGYICNPLYP
jgi:hypothetical protein